MRDNVLWRKIAWIIILIAKELGIDEEQALTIFLSKSCVSNA